jgi:HAD superfamily hydrolase (TIGR01509 family)
MGEIKVILSDFDGVVANKFTEMSARDFCSKYGVIPNEFKNVSAGAVKGLDEGLKNNDEYLNDLIVGLKLKISPDEMQSFFAEADRRNIRRDPSVWGWLKEIKKRGIVVGLATNVSKDLAGRLSAGVFYYMFEKRYFSHAIGASKTDNRFWRYVLNDLAVDPESVAFIDDNETNVDVARAAGIRGFLYKDFSQTKKDIAGLIS